MYHKKGLYSLLKHFLLFILLAAWCLTFASATSINPLTKPQADTLYCKIGESCGGNFTGSNITINNPSVTNETIFIDWTHVLNLFNETIIRATNISWWWTQPNSTFLYDYNISKLMSGSGDNPTNETIFIDATHILNLSYSYYNKTEIDAMFNSLNITSSKGNGTIIEQLECDGTCTTVIEYEYN